MSGYLVAGGPAGARNSAAGDGMGFGFGKQRGGQLPAEQSSFVGRVEEVAGCGAHSTRGVW
ncbi:hypothetical protein [Streptomyces sp. NPDC006012]|uniref:hypothetical protein n=1 Tax=Streptomyces sp. NPDC006012 TaxID=3364739 RepID=UPI003697C4F9